MCNSAVDYEIHVLLSKIMHTIDPTIATSEILVTPYNKGASDTVNRNIDKSNVVNYVADGLDFRPLRPLTRQKTRQKQPTPLTSLVQPEQHY